MVHLSSSDTLQMGVQHNLPDALWLPILAAVITGLVIFISWRNFVGTVRDGVYDKR